MSGTGNVASVHAKDMFDAEVTPIDWLAREEGALDGDYDPQPAAFVAKVASSSRDCSSRRSTTRSRKSSVRAKSSR